MMNTQLFVCNNCLDVPYEFNRPIVTPPDPLPIRNPRPAQTDTGPVGWDMGAWSVGRWSIGQSPTQPASIPSDDLVSPEVGGTFDE